MKSGLLLLAFGAGLLGLAFIVRFGVINFDRREDSQRDAEVVRLFPNSFKDISGLRYVVERPGTGAKPYPGSEIRIDYTVRVLDGPVFDSTEKRGAPMRLRVGQDGLLKGLDQGLLSMRAGERRIVLIPPHLGYGRRGRPPEIPPDATLVVTVDLLEVLQGGG